MMILPQQTRDEHLAAMPAPLGEIFNRLWNETVIVHDTWNTFRELFVVSRDRVTLENSTAGIFFSDVAHLLGDSLMLHVCRMTDPAKQGKYHNLSLAQLADNIPDQSVQNMALGLLAAGTPTLIVVALGATSG